MDILKQIAPASAVSFSGHRPERLPGQGNPEMPETKKLASILREQIEEAVLRDKDTFINGLMAGWDILAAEQTAALKNKYPHIKLVTVAPFSEGFFSREKCWTDEWITRAQEIYKKSDINISITEYYRPGIYYERNYALVDNSSELFCCWDGGKGGTKHTIQYAITQKLIIKNFFKEGSILTELKISDIINPTKKVGGYKKWDRKNIT